MSSTLALEQNLAATLSKLETALLSPVVAGELSNWARTVQETAATLAVELASYLRTVSHVQYADIVETDPEMSAQIEALIRNDQQLLEQLASFHEELHALAEAAAHVKKNEGKLAEQQQRVERKGIALILSIKKQQAAATTWFAEAHLRDHGVAAD